MRLSSLKSTLFFVLVTCLVLKLYSKPNVAMLDSSKIFRYVEFLENLDGTSQAPDTDMEFTDMFPYCNSTNTYPSPFIPIEFSALPFSTFCSNNVVNNITNRGTDISYQVISGGDVNIPPTGGATLEGRLAVKGNLTVNKAPAPFRIGESISGTAVVSEPGPFLLVGGNSSGAGRINTGASAFGNYTAKISGTNNLTINGATVQSNAPLSFDIDTLLSQSNSMSDLMADLPTTGTFSAGFVGSNDSLEVFNISGTDLAGTGVLPFSNIAPFATVIINISGETVNYQKSVYNGRKNDPFAVSNSSDVDATVYNVVWNFFEAKTVNIIASPAEGIQGLVLAPLGNVDFRTNLNGRLIAGGNVDLNGFGVEFHNYPFTGDLSKVIETQVIRECIIAEKDVTNTPISTGTTIDVLANDTFEELNTTSVTISAGALNGSGIINPDRTISYTPVAGFQGLDSVKYVLCDTASKQKNCDSAYVVVLVGLEAVDDDVFVESDNLTTFSPLLNDIINPEKTTIDTISGGSNGSIILNPDGTVGYTAFNGFSGRDTVVFVVCDTSTAVPLCDTSIAVIRVLSILPDAIRDNHATTINTTLNVPLLSNDIFADINLLSVSIVTPPIHGSFVQQADLSYDFIPDVGYTGLDSLVYEICDTTILPGVCDRAKVIITIDPEAVNDTLSITSGEEITFFPLLNDTINVFVTTFDTLSGPLNGIISRENGTEITYVPDVDFIGVDTFKYVICDTSELVILCDTALIYINVLPKAPKAVDDICATELNGALTIPVLLNDILENPLKTEVSSVQFISVNGATAGLNLDGTVSYTPQLNFRGLDSIQYVICDTSLSPFLCDSAFAIIMVGPLAVDDSLITASGVPVSSFVLNNDTINPAKTTIDLLSTGSNGGATLNPIINQVSYLPNTGFAGVDTIDVLVCDTSKFPFVCDTSLLIVKVLSPPPVIVNDLVETFKNQGVFVDFIFNDFLPNKGSTKLMSLGTPKFGSLTGTTDSTLTYLPDLNFLGFDSVKYVLCDTLVTPFSCDSGFVVISVIEKPSPIAVLDVSATELNTAVLVAVLDNDLLPDRPNTIVKSVTFVSTSGGSVSVLPDNSVEYIPALDFKGIDTLKYVLCDTIVDPDLSDSAFIVITVGPDAVDDSISVKTGTEISINILDNDTVNVPYTVVNVVSNPNNGVLKDSINGIITYVSNDNFVGYDTITLSICDTSVSPNICDTSLLIIKVIPESFVALDDMYFLGVNSSVVAQTLQNDTLSPVSNLSYDLLTFPNNGSVVLQPDLSLVYTPTNDFEGTDTLTYKVCDTVLLPNICDSARVVFTIKQSPIANVDTLFVNEDEIGTINLVENDIDLGNDTLKLIAVNLVSELQNGTLTFDSTGDVIFEPNDNYFGTILFTSVIEDVNGATDFSNFVIVVAPVNDVPFVLLEPERLTIVNGGNTEKSPNLLLNNLDIENDDLFVKNIVKSQADFIGFTVSDSTISYLPTRDFIGIDTVLYLVCDRGIPEECMVDTLIVTVVPQSDENLFVPEAFSPNNDGINDFFEIVGLENFESNSIKVFNRWGNTVFQEDNYKNKWGGVNNVSLSGRLLPASGYLYVLVLTKASGEEIILKGSVFINR